MIPNTLSASSLKVAELCMDRWHAEHMVYGRSESNSAADVGTSVHGALEAYVKLVYIDKTHDPSFDLLVTHYQMSYVQTFGTTDMETVQYKDGYELIKKWFPRTKFDDREVLNVEEKKRFPIPYNHPDGPTHQCEKCEPFKDKYPPGTCIILWTYIIDRLDRLEDGTYEVVDYKTIRAPVQPEDLERMVQAQGYALAIQIEHPEAERIKVTFDLLRHERVSIFFTRQDNINFWHRLTMAVQNIVDLKEEDIKPKLNKECGYCVKKTTCPLIQQNIQAGGIHSLSIDEKIALKYKLDSQVKAAKLIQEEIADYIYQHAANTEQIEWVTEDLDYEVKVGAGRARTFDTYKAAKIMGPELFAQLGNLTLGKLDDLIKDPSVDPEIRKQLKDMISYTQGNLRLSVEKKSPNL